MKHINKLLLLLIATTLFSGILIGVFPSHASASLSMEEDYKIYRSYTLVSACIIGDWHGDVRKNNLQDTINAGFRNNEQFADGKLYSSLIGNDIGSGFDCNTKDDLNPALQALGYDGVYELIEDLGTTTITKDKIIDKLRDQVKKQGGRLDLLNKPDFQYWYWNTVYREKLGTGGCEGVLNNSYSSNRETNIPGTYYKAEDDGTVTKYSVASYNTGTGREVEGLDRSMTGGKKWTCKGIADQLTKSRAEAYAARLVINNNDDDESNDYGTGALSSGAAGVSDPTSCESEGGVLGWIMCPVTTMLGNALNWVDTQISRLLEVDEVKFRDAQLYTTWARFRNIGLTLLIIIMLIMVISTALGLGFLDAYTVKKAMPRMIAAIIFMLLSWYICLFLITLSNAVGEGVLGLMTSTFRDPYGNRLESLNALFSAGGASTAVQGGGLIVGVGVLALVPGALGIVMTWVGAALLIVGLALLVLVARQMFIITLILFSPIAILAWIFPGNDKLWNFWWQSFSKLLLMFPMIMALIASGRIFAGVISFTADSSSGGESLITPLLILTAYVIPYAFIPFTFKFAGGVFGNLAGMVNDRGKGAFDRLRKSRQKSYARIATGAKTGNFTRGRETGFDRGVRRLAHANKAGLRPGSWRANTDSAIVGTIAQEKERKLKEDPDYATWSMHDTLNRAASESTNEAQLRERLLAMRAEGQYRGTDADMERDVGRVERLRRSMSEDGFRQLTTSQAIKGGTAYGSQAEAWRAVAAAAGDDDATLATMTAQARGDMMSAGRIDQGGGGFGRTMELTAQLRDHAIDDDEFNRLLSDNVLESQGPGVLAHPSMKPGAIQALIPAMRNRVQTAAAAAQASGDWDTYDRELAVISSIHDSLSPSSPQIARQIADDVLLQPSPATIQPQPPLSDGSDGPPLPVPAGSQTILDHIKMRGQSKVFQSTHKEHSQIEQDPNRPGAPPIAGPGGPSTGPPTAPPTGL